MGETEKTVKRNLWLHIRVTAKEKEKVLAICSKSTSRTLSEYARSVLMAKPVVTTYRNESLDDTMAELIQLRKELNNIGNNFNQAVHKLHMVDHIPQLKIWLHIYDKERSAVSAKVEEIKAQINRMADIWLQK